MLLTVTANPTIDKVYFVDRLSVGEVHRPFKVTASAGGKGINVSRVARLLGEDTVALGFLGANAEKFVEDELESIGISTLFTSVSGNTRTNFNISDSSGLSTELLEEGPYITEEEKESLIKKYKEKICDSDIICISGSLPKGLESSFYIELIRLAKAQGKMIIADTSGTVLLDILNEAPFMIKPNKDELCDILGFKAETEDDIKKALMILYNKGISLPIITLGGDGAYCYIDEKFYRFRPPTVSVKNAVGSGDSCVAGIAVGLSRGLDFKNALALGMACGTANTQFDETGFVSKKLVDMYLNEIKYEVI